MSLPSKEMLPARGLYHRSSRPMIVLFPEPDDPFFFFFSRLTRDFYDRYDQRLLTTNAVTLPAGIFRVKSSKTVTSGRVG